MASSAAIKGRSGGDGDGGGGCWKGKAVVVSPEARKKAEESGRSGVSFKQRSVIVAPKTELIKVKGNTVTSSSKTISKTATTKTTGARVKAEKKVYTLPGQKHDPPEEREPLRIFYESLSKQIPSSEMAEFWMMEHGLLSPVSAKKAYERKQRRQQQIRTCTPIKSTKQEWPESSKRLSVSKNGDVKAKKRVQYSDDEDDFIVKHRKIKA